DQGGKAVVQIRYDKTQDDFYKSRHNGNYANGTGTPLRPKHL
ncbi:hypothetical protein V495_08209, partial [Pseudogymnoascus sp. VKM F-4514 (FW-929)]